jgi:hypothetical protein
VGERTTPLYQGVDDRLGNSILQIGSYKEPILISLIEPNCIIDVHAHRSSVHHFENLQDLFDTWQEQQDPAFQ